ncbi:hypothetical protein ScPMuIL_017724 [Solemya velum]
MAYYVLKALANIAYCNEKYAKQTIATLVIAAKGTEVPTVTSALGRLRILREKYLDLIIPYKASLLKNQNHTSSGHLKDACVGLIDIIEGRSLAVVHHEVKQQQEDIEDLDERVTMQKSL